jgi:hypothetical protein
LENTLCRKGSKIPEKSAVVGWEVEAKAIDEASTVKTPVDFIAKTMLNTLDNNRADNDEYFGSWMRRLSDIN